MQEKKNRFGRYYIAKATLSVKNKKYIAKQERIDPRKIGSVWRLTRRQMIDILDRTMPDDWLFSLVGEYDGQYDGWRHVNQSFVPAQLRTIRRIVDELQKFERTIAEYNVEENTFEIWDCAVFHYRLKPSHQFIALKEND